MISRVFFVGIGNKNGKMKLPFCGVMSFFLFFIERRDECGFESLTSPPPCGRPPLSPILIAEESRF